MEKKKNFINSVTLSGKIESIDRDRIRRGTLENGAEWLGFRGRIMCCSNSVQFDVFVSSKKYDGSESENYKNIDKWLADVTTMSENPDHPTMATMIGNLADNPWPDRTGVCREDVKGTMASIKFINPFDGTEACYMTIDAYIDAITDEIVDDDVTGRKNMTIFTREFGNKAIKIKEIKVPANLVEGITSAGWEKGASVNMNLQYVTQEKEKSSDSGVAFGMALPSTTGVVKYSELVVIGGGNAYDPDGPKAFSPEEVEELKRLKLDQNSKAINRKGGETAQPTSFGSATPQAPKKVVEEEDTEADW